MAVKRRRVGSRRSSSINSWERKILYLAALALLVISGVKAAEAVMRQQFWQKVEGTVTRLEKHQGLLSDEEQVMPYFTYSMPGAEELYTIKAQSGVNPTTYRLNQRVELLYSDEHPEDAVLNTPRDLYRPAMFYLLLALGVGLLGMIGRRSWLKYLWNFRR